MSDSSVTLSRPADEPPSDLLAADEPPPFRILGQGTRQPLLWVCDHASAFIPRSLNCLGLDNAVLARHIAWDIGIAEVTERLIERLGGVGVFSHFSRLIIDPNRDLADPTSIPQISDGVIVPGNRGLSPADRRQRVESFFAPYHAALSRTIEQLLSEGIVPAVISMHSFTPVMKGVERPWEIGILWNEDGRIPLPLIARLTAQGCVVGDNQPYSGKNDHGYSVHEQAEKRRLPHVLIELRQDLIDTHHGAAEWADRLGDALEEVLSDREIYRRGSG